MDKHAQLLDLLQSYADASTPQDGRTDSENERLGRYSQGLAIRIADAMLFNSELIEHLRKMSGI